MVIFFSPDADSVRSPHGTKREIYSSLAIKARVFCLFSSSSLGFQHCVRGGIFNYSRHNADVNGDSRERKKYLDWRDDNYNGVPYNGNGMGNLNGDFCKYSKSLSVDFKA